MLKKKEDRSLSPPSARVEPSPTSPTSPKNKPKSKELPAIPPATSPPSFSLFSLGVALPAVHGSSTKKEHSSKKEKEHSSKKEKAPRTAVPTVPAANNNVWTTTTSTWSTNNWATTWEAPAAAPALVAPTQSNPLYQPRPFADVLLTDSHPRRFELDRRAKDTIHHVSWQ